VVYTFTCHNKIVQHLLTKNNTIKVWEIILSALTTGSFLATILSQEKLTGVVGATISIALLKAKRVHKKFRLGRNFSITSEGC
jgi:hypothetical protein